MMGWRYIPFQRYDPYFKTGLNRAVMESVNAGKDPVVFLCGWDRKCVNVGRSQKVEEQVELEKVREDGIEIVRRQGGGGTTYLTPDGEISWGIVATEEFLPEDVNSTYAEICGLVADALGELGIDAEHEPINDVLTGGKKISGATLKQEKETAYVGGTLLYSLDPEEMFTYLTPEEDKLKDKQVSDFKERVTSVELESDASFGETRKALKEQLLKDRDWHETGWTTGEIERARELANKYRDEEWIYQ